MIAKTIARVAVTAALLFSALPAYAAATISFNTSAATVTVGSTFTIDVMAQDINLGGFDLNLKFKPLLSPYISATFGSALGDVGVLSFGDVTDNLDVLELSQVSFAGAADLTALQGTAPGNSYKLLTLTFSAASPGTATFEIDPSTAFLSDFNGNPLSADFIPARVVIGDAGSGGDGGGVVPEPATWMLSATAGAVLLFFRRYGRR